MRVEGSPCPQRSVVLFNMTLTHPVQRVFTPPELETKLRLGAGGTRGLSNSPEVPDSKARSRTPLQLALNATCCLTGLWWGDHGKMGLKCTAHSRCSTKTGRVHIYDVRMRTLRLGAVT